MTHEPTVSIEELLRHGEFLGKLAGRLASDRASAEDLVQDVWVKALSRPPAAADNLKQWLAQVLRHHAVSTHRTRKSRERSESVKARPEESGGEGSDAVAAREDLRRFLAEAVLSLSAGERSVVILRFYSGLSAEECARELGIAPRTVRQRTSNAFAHLRRRIGAAFAAEGDATAAE
jgi:RNA polymerase sigma-70 factor (ECF subfamily)